MRGFLDFISLVNFRGVRYGWVCEHAVERMVDMFESSFCLSIHPSLPRRKGVLRCQCLEWEVKSRGRWSLNIYNRVGFLRDERKEYRGRQFP